MRPGLKIPHFCVAKSLFLTIIFYQKMKVQFDACKQLFDTWFLYSSAENMAFFIKYFLGEISNFGAEIPPIVAYVLIYDKFGSNFVLIKQNLPNSKS